MTGAKSLQGVPADPQAEAAEWFTRLRADDADPDMLADFVQWRDKDADNADAYARIEALWNDVGTIADEPEILRARMAALTLRAAPPPRRWLPQLVATSLVLISSVGLLWTIIPAPSPSPAQAPATMVAAREKVAQPPKSPPAATPHSAQFEARYRTAIGQQARFVLPDGSRVELNTDSLVAVTYTPSGRNLQLVRGEAIFRVARDARRPFAVAAGGERVVALGTVFAVRKDARRVQVTLLEGKVRIEREAAMVGGVRAELTPGEQIILPANLPFEISRASFDDAASWRNGRLHFDAVRLAEAVGEINRYTDRKLVIGDPQVSELRISGTLRIGSADHFASALAAGFPVRLADRRNGDIMILPANAPVTPQE